MYYYKFIINYLLNNNFIIKIKGEKIIVINNFIVFFFMKF